MNNKEENEFVSYLLDLLRTIGPVSAKKMFGGYGFFMDGLMFALMADDIFYFKVDEKTEANYKTKKLEAFSYKKKNRVYSMSYYQSPAEALENSEVMSLWANEAFKVALRASAKKQKKY